MWVEDVEAVHQRCVEQGVAVTWPPADLGRGYGTRMMTLALARCFETPGVGGVLTDPLASNVRAHRFYERLGFRRVGRRRFGEDDCLVFRLDRADHEASRGRT